MIFHISSRSGIPPYIQIVQQVKQNLRLGLLKEGDKLPTVREVVTMIVINPNTVVKAYRQLENQGLVEKRAGIGTFVTKRPAGPSPETQSMLLKDLENWIMKAESAGLDEESTEALFNAALRKRREEHTDGHNTNEE